MEHHPDSVGFYDSLPRRSAFTDLARPECYSALPDDWVLGTADIIGSTQAIRDGRYKTVNMVGAAVISAQINQSAGRSFPFVFGGDGAGFACAPDRADASAQALAAVQVWARDEFGLALRIAQTPVSAVRAAGRDVAVARYQAAPGIDYAMFSGGGLNWAERQMKQGAFSIPPAPPGTVPDLTGLSCRWSNVKAQNGTILSIVVSPTQTADDTAFAAVAQDLVAIAERLSRNGHPVPMDGPGVNWPPPGLSLDAHVSRAGGSLTARKMQLLFGNLLAWLLFKTGINVGGFDPKHYAQTVSANADYRKFDDGLKMTLDSDPETTRALRDILERAAQAGVVQYGIHQQDEAMMTCIVPSALQDDHVHFVDGASGGYTQAAMQIRSD